jgi:hypothetical protein
MSRRSDLKDRHVKRQTSQAQMRVFQEASGEAEAEVAREASLYGIDAGPKAVARSLRPADGAARARILERLHAERGNSYVQRVIAQAKGAQRRLEEVRSATAREAAIADRDGRDLPVREPASTDSRAGDGRAIVQRYQAGDTGHGGIESRALTSTPVGMSSDQASQVYFGNWLRDLSQLPSVALPLINILAMGEFGREIKQGDLGTYVPSEHLDNPEGGGTIEDSRIQALEHSTKPEERKQFEEALNKLSADQRRAYDDEQQHRADILAAKEKGHLPEYIERGKWHAKAKLADALRVGANPDGRRLMGDALHAVEDYYSHSNFTEAAIWTLYRNGAPVGPLVDRMANTTLGANSALAGGIDPQGHPKIVTGTYAPGANDWVSRFELLKSEIEHGQLTKAFVVGWLRINGIRGEEIGRRLGKSVFGAIGTGVGAVVGGVSGAVSGSVRGAKEGWEQHRGLSAVGHAITGFFGGLFGGAAKGAREGSRKGQATGEAVGSAVGSATGRVLGFATAAIEEIVAVAGVAAIMAVFPEIAVAMAALIIAAKTDVVANLETKASGEQARKLQLAGPTHSQIAKDAPDNPLFGVSVQLAEAADRDIGGAMQIAWGSKSGTPGGEANPDQVKAVKDLVDKYVSPPEHDPWWQPILLAAVKT